MGEDARIAITISKQMGSGGSYVGYLVAKDLGFKYIDREILRQAAERLGTNASALENHDERSCGLIDDLKISDDGVLGFSVLCESLFVLVRQVCSNLMDGF